MSDGMQPPGWYPAEGDPPGTVRWWDGGTWVGGPQQQGAQQQAGYLAPNASGLANGRELADPWLRIAAYIIDAIIVTIITAPFGAAVIFSAIQDGGASSGEIGIGLPLIGSIVGAAYYALMYAFKSATLGKLALGLRIVGEDGTEPLGIPAGPIRAGTSIAGILSVIPILGVLITIVILIVGLVSLVFLFSDSQNRTVMDRVAKTYVVKKQG